MAPDLISIDPSFEDDAHLLAAIERAWPVPPMPGRLTTVAFSPSEPVAPGNLIAPMVPSPARRSWSLLTRIAAVIALVLAGTLAITHENGPERGAPIFIQAPSPVTADCSVPLRSREDLEALIVEASASELPDPDYLRVHVYSTFETSPATEAERETLEDNIKEQQRCMQNGVPYARLTSISDAYVEFFIARNLIAGRSPETVLDRLLTPDPPSVGQDQLQWEYSAGRYKDQLLLYAGSSDADYADGLWFVQQDGQWVMDGAAIVLGPWSSLGATVVARDVSFESPECDVAGSIRTSRDAQELNDRLNDEGIWPPVDRTSPPEAISIHDGSTMSTGDQQSITEVVDAYRGCMQAGYLPYQYVLTSDDFFRRYSIADQQGVVEVHFGAEGNVSPRQQSLIPFQVQSVIQLDDGRAVAILESNPEWAEASGLKAGILLVNQNGQWLIDQLVLVQDS